MTFYAQSSFQEGKGEPNNLELLFKRRSQGAEASETILYRGKI